MVLVNYFKDLFNISSNIGVVSLPASKEIPLKIEYTKSVTTNHAVGAIHDGKPPLWPFIASDVFRAKICSWRRLTADDTRCKDVYEVSFDIDGSNFKFNAGDTIGVIPQNSSEDVENILKHLGLLSEAELPYALHLDNTQKGAKLPIHVPVVSTLRHVFTHCLDIRSVLKKLFILALSRHTKDANERKVLEYLCSKEGSDAYSTHILKQHLCILDLFNIFKSCKPPVEILLANLPRLLPRPYSIANSSKKNPNILRICFSVMSVTNNRKGLTTGWLEDMILNRELRNIEEKINNLNLTEESLSSLDKRVPIYMRKNVSGVSFIDNMKSDLVLIGPGTGVAPYIGFLEERECLQKNSPDDKLGDIWLFFGCRHRDLDYIYEKELNRFLQNGSLKKLNVAFSRDENSKHKYVQDALLENGEQLTSLIENGAFVYVCGDSKTMPAQIKDVLMQCFNEYGGYSQEEAKKFIEDLQKRKRYVVDVWT